METILWILGIGAVIGALFAAAHNEDPAAGAVAGAAVTGSCMVQLLIPAVGLLAGLWLLSQIIA